MSGDELRGILAQSGKRRRARSTSILIAILLVLVGVFIGLAVGVALPG